MMRIKLSILLSILCLCTYGQKIGRSLPDYLEAAKQYSPLLHDYRNQLQIEQAELRRLKSLYTRSRLELNGDYLFVPVLTKDGGQTSFRWNALPVRTRPDQRRGTNLFPVERTGCHGLLRLRFGREQRAPACRSHVDTAALGTFVLQSGACLPSSGRQMTSYAFRPNSLITRT